MMVDEGGLKHNIMIMLLLFNCSQHLALAVTNRRSIISHVTPIGTFCAERAAKDRMLESFAYCRSSGMLV
jgi:hypothetical protein